MAVDTKENRSPETQQPLTIDEQRKQYNKAVAAFDGYKLKLDEIWNLYQAQASIANTTLNATGVVPIPTLTENALRFFTKDTTLWNALSTEISPLASGRQFANLFYQFINDERRKDLKGDIPTTGRKPVDRRHVLSLLNDAQNRLTGNNATESSEGLDISAYKTSLNAAVELLNVLRGDVVKVRDIVNEIKNQIERENTAFKQRASRVGNDFALPSIWEAYRTRNETIITKIDALKNAILTDKESIKNDIARNITLANQGFIEDPKNPGTFIKNTNAEKDPWGIRFTVLTGRTTGSAVVNNINQKLAREAAQNNAPKENGDGTEAEQNASNQSVPDLKANDKRTKIKDDLLSGTTLFESSSYYMHLLPAIRSNLPVQGGTDVPGAQPGLNFRVEHSIVKHKVPGFQPIYQPMGVDCIKCTIVGCFTGADGVQLWNEQEQLDGGGNTDGSGKGIKDGNTTMPIDLYGRGDDFESLRKTKPDLNKFGLAALSRSYDSFKNVQEFYNLIVAPGKEVEVEINMRKSDLVTGGGSNGPFRDTVTGNPKFKALIKRMDTYLVRADRTWYILDLEITDGGLIGKECLNLTKELNETKNVIRDAEINEVIADAEIDQFRKCIDSLPTKLILKSNDPDYTQYVIDLNTGYGYRGPVEVNTVDQTYTPDQFLELLSAKQSGEPGSLDEFGGFGNLTRQMQIGDNKVNGSVIAAQIISNSYPLSKIATTSVVGSRLEVDPDQTFLVDRLPNRNGSGSRRADQLIGFDRKSNRFVALTKTGFAGLGPVKIDESRQSWTPQEFIAHLGDAETVPVIDRDRYRAINAMRDVINRNGLRPKPNPCSNEAISERTKTTLDANGVRRGEKGATLLFEAEAPRFVNTNDCTQDQINKNVSFQEELRAGVAAIAITAAGTTTATALTASTLAGAQTVLYSQILAGAGTAVGGGTTLTGSTFIAGTSTVTVQAAQISALSAIGATAGTTIIIAGGIILVAAAAVVGGVLLWKKLDQGRCDKRIEGVKNQIEGLASNRVFLLQALKAFLYPELRTSTQQSLTDNLVSELASSPPITPNFESSRLSFVSSSGDAQFTQNYVAYVDATFELSGTKRGVTIGNTVYTLDSRFNVRFGISRNDLEDASGNITLRVSSVEIKFNGATDQQPQEVAFQNSFDYADPNPNAEPNLNSLIYEQPFT